MHLDALHASMDFGTFRQLVRQLLAAMEVARRTRAKADIEAVTQAAQEVKQALKWYDPR